MIYILIFLTLVIGLCLRANFRKSQEIKRITSLYVAAMQDKIDAEQTLFSERNDRQKEKKHYDFLLSKK